MNVSSSPPVGFAGLVEEHLGLHSDVPTSRAWDSVLADRLAATHCQDFASYSQRLSSVHERREELGQVAQRITIGETYFFRDSRQFEALMTVVLPELLNRRPSAAKVRVLSVACSTGEEPFSVAMAARELLGSRADRIQIHAFDVNPNAIAAARRATYSEWALRATPTNIRSRYFSLKGNQYVLSPAIRDAVEFEVRNLFETDSDFWKSGRFDVVLCRNALIYFSRRKIASALRRFADVLPPDGTLLLGNAETPRGFEERLIARELCGSFCYRVASPSTPPSARATPAPAALQDSQLPASVAVEPLFQPNLDADTGGAWVTIIDAATQRLASLVQPKAADRAACPESTCAAHAETLLKQARQLVQSERFGDALRKLDEVAGKGHEASDVHLLRASILTNQGRFAESVDLCHRLLADYPHCAGAYHLLGVASEQLGQLEEARRHHETAIILDPCFTMSYWLLGRLCLRSGQCEPARRHLKRALELWQLEEMTSGSNPELFTGGFGRDALERLCRADLAKCEVRR